LPLKPLDGAKGTANTWRINGKCFGKLTPTFHQSLASGNSIFDRGSSMNATARGVLIKFYHGSEQILSRERLDRERMDTYSA